MNAIYVIWQFLVLCWFKKNQISYFVVSFNMYPQYSTLNLVDVTTNIRMLRTKFGSYCRHDHDFSVKKEACEDEIIDVISEVN